MILELPESTPAAGSSVDFTGEATRTKDGKGFPQGHGKETQNGRGWNGPLEII